MAGNPALTKDERDDYLKKIEPYLKAGLSIRKACLEAEIPASTVYSLIQYDEQFRDKVHQYQQFLSVLMANSMVAHFHHIISKQRGNEKEGKQAKPLTKDDLGFLQWFALNAKATKEEFGERKQIDTFDPESEIKRIQDLIDSQIPPTEVKNKDSTLPTTEEDDITNDDTTE